MSCYVSAVSLRFHLLPEKSWGQADFNSMCFCLARTARYTHNVAQIRFREWTVKWKITVQSFFLFPSFCCFVFIDKHGFIPLNYINTDTYNSDSSVSKYLLIMWGNFPQIVVVFRNPYFFQETLDVSGNWRRPRTCRCLVCFGERTVHNYGIVPCNYFVINWWHYKGSSMAFKPWADEDHRKVCKRPGKENNSEFLPL